MEPDMFSLQPASCVTAVEVSDERYEIMDEQGDAEN
jgi:hypothetical protein